MPHSDRSFDELAAGTKREVDAALEALGAEQSARARGIHPELGVVVDALFDLTNRGGKRLRPAFVGAAYVACGGAATRDVLPAGLAFEVLQSYLLIHDDWMDRDEVRRGGPSVHAALRERFGSRDLGDACAILAGDYAVGLAQELLLRVTVPAERLVAAAREFATMQMQVVSGQVLDVRGVAISRADVETMHRLKTSSYTATGPIAIGAILAGAETATVDALRAAGTPIGIAFQLQDDLLGTFGDPNKTGKSVRSDLRRGRRTALVAELAGDRQAEPMLARVLGVDDAPDDEVDAVLERMVSSGAKARVEARLQELLSDAKARIEAVTIRNEGRSLLLGAIAALQGRKA